MSISSKSTSSDGSDFSGILDWEKQKIVQRIREQLDPPLLLDDDQMRVIGASDDGSRSCASIGISRLSIPLAWNEDEFFKGKGENRCFSMFVTLHTKQSVVDSKLITNINRHNTDVDFPDSFTFYNEPDDFCVEVSVYCARTDCGGDGMGSIKQRITRSLGRKFGSNVKTQLTVPDPRRNLHIPDAVGNTHFNLVARALLVLTDADEKTRIHDLKTSVFADLSGPPLYGHLICRMVCLPNSVPRPIAEGILTIRPSSSESIYQHVHSRLQAGVLRCTVNNDEHRNPTMKQSLLRIILTPRSRIVPCNLPESLLLINESLDEPITQYIITTDSGESAQRWIRALEHQINDTAMWGEFAYVHTQLAQEKIPDVQTTLSRSNGVRLFDSSFKGNSYLGSYGFGHNLSLFNPHSNGNVTAPHRRPRQRMNVKEIFRVDEEETSDDNNSPRNSRYVINMNVGEGSSPLTKVRNSYYGLDYELLQAPSATSYGTGVSPVLSRSSALTSSSSGDGSQPGSGHPSPLPCRLRHSGSETTNNYNYHNNNNNATKNENRRSWTKGLGNLLTKRSPTVEITRL